MCIGNVGKVADGKKNIHWHYLFLPPSNAHVSLYSVVTMLSVSVISVEMEHRLDFELREGLVESRYWSAVTSHTAYWNSHDVALFLLTFIYKSQSSSETSQDNPDPE